MKGEPITREVAADLARTRGMIVAESVTKKLDLLVVADPLTQSGKAAKARRYGIRIMHEAVFWRSLRVEVE
jgi:DNA polymerase III subunit epsilon